MKIKIIIKVFIQKDLKTTFIYLYMNTYKYIRTDAYLYTSLYRIEKIILDALMLKSCLFKTQLKY